MPLSCLSAIYGEISLKETEFSQRNLEKNIEELKFNYKPENAQVKEEINRVLMQANDLLEYRDKIIEAFKDGNFSSEHLKKSDTAAYDYVLKDVNNFIQKIELISENISPNLFNEVFELSLADYAKEYINTKNPDNNKEFVAETKEKISNLKDRIKKMSETEKINKNADETLKIIEEILDYNKNVQKKFPRASKVEKEKSVSKKTIVERNIEESVKLRRRRIDETEEEDKYINNELFKKYFTDYQSLRDICKKLCKTAG